MINLVSEVTAPWVDMQYLDSLCESLGVTVRIAEDDNFYDGGVHRFFEKGDASFELNANRWCATSQPWQDLTTFLESLL